ncbi:hypothetical protein [Anaerolentibacter hominis]|uniref:hypothetical protein n=1 Tax=Anaerolentibacter hominis TaxID=3079009 RepID=UPI0031B88461
MKRTILAVTLLLTMMLLLTACSDKDSTAGSGNSDPSPDSAAAADKEDDKDDEDVSAASDDESAINEIISVAGWTIGIENVEIDKSLENASTILGYTNVATSKFTAEAEDGYEYCLVKMSFEKEDSTEDISWDKFVLTDSEGNTYSRCDDSFLSDLGMKRIPGTSLNFGSHEGWLAFEIKEGASGLTISYPFENDTFEYAID